MSALYSFAVLVLVIFVAIAPRRVLGPVFGLVRRVLGAGVIALACLGTAIYIFSNAASAPYRPYGVAALGLGAQRLLRPASPAEHSLKDSRPAHG